MHLDRLSQIGGGSRTIRTVAHPDNVSCNLNRGKNQAPRKSPPSEKAGHDHPHGLLFDAAGTATDKRPAFPLRQDHHGPNLVGFMNINRPVSAALGAFAAPYLLDLLLQNLSRNVLRVEDKGIVSAGGIAKFLRSMGNAAHQDSGIAIRASGHGGNCGLLLQRCLMNSLPMVEAAELAFLAINANFSAGGGTIQKHPPHEEKAEVANCEIISFLHGWGAWA